MKKVLFMIVFSGLIFCSFEKVYAYDMDGLFMARQWSEIDRIVSDDLNELSPREVSLATNALWLQGRWSDALPFLLDNRESLPEELKAYQDMLIVLGYERTGQSGLAREKAEDLMKSAPDGLSYYVAYSLARLSQGDEKPRWYSKMLKNAITSDQRQKALQGLVETGKADINNCLELLEMEPNNEKAFNLASGLDGEKPASFPYHAGMYYYMKDEWSKATEYFSAVSADIPQFAKSSYYHGLALTRQSRNEDALRIWAKGGMSKGWYASASVRRIAGFRNRYPSLVAELLEYLSESTTGDQRAASLFYLTECYEGGEREKYEDLLMEEFPDSDFSASVLWEKGWSFWMEGKKTKALETWETSLSRNFAEKWRSRFLFWTGMSYRNVGDNEEGEKYLNSLVSDYPLNHYSILYSPDALVINDSDYRPEGYEISELEKWGFMPYARIELSRADTDGAKLRYAEISEWFGDHYAAYAAALSLKDRFAAVGKGFPRYYMEMIYPRPYVDEVLEASSETGIDPLLIWSVMRRESAFNSSAVSSAGARGLMQLMPSTANDEATRLGMSDYTEFDPRDNVLLGSSHLSWLSGRLEELHHVLAAYNAGSGNLSKWVNKMGETSRIEFMESIPFEETSEYVKKVIANYEVYKKLYAE